MPRIILVLALVACSSPPPSSGPRPEPPPPAPADPGPTPADPPVTATPDPPAPTTPPDDKRPAPKRGQCVDDADCVMTALPEEPSCCQKPCGQRAILAISLPALEAKKPKMDCRVVKCAPPPPCKPQAEMKAVCGRAGKCLAKPK